MPTRVTDDVLSPVEVCEQYPRAFRNTQALADLRWRGRGPSYIKTAPGRAGRVLYRRSAIEKWLDSLTVETGGAAA
ncbi:DNA-binding protein [Streptomyces caniscabiei]|uniref:DNA-binding protein n=1 Tax=Streptomyces caniscabiei TaxID=2746961 RepID=A0A927QHI3_9ACTN|nr:DNA-binding protein [Streptomyces caniscabiei]MBD9727318.1 DNA-binding protein [Streptomyces caniscabiei]MDX3512352.1 DNA-binding protein [Streptomyces caniscabiei]MDX3721603.1 DNA-binding protein [Streptomyces caniscabiei]WEO26323.1 DNA-binding protein [Streptomyces caniscabiei]